MTINYALVFEPVIGLSRCVCRPTYVTHLSVIDTLLDPQTIITQFGSANLKPRHFRGAIIS